MNTWESQSDKKTKPYFLKNTVNIFGISANKLWKCKKHINKINFNLSDFCSHFRQVFVTIQNFILKVCKDKKIKSWYSTNHIICAPVNWLLCKIGGFFYKILCQYSWGNFFSIPSWTHKSLQVSGKNKHVFVNFYVFRMVCLTNL